MNVNDKIFDRIVEHMTDVRLYEEGVQVENQRIIRRHRKRLTDLLKGNLRADVKPEVTRFAKELAANAERSLREFSTSQLDFHADNLYKEVRQFYKVQRPRTKELLGEITGPSIKGPTTLSKNLSNISSGELVRIQTKVRAGLARGATPNQIIDDVMKTTRLTEVQARTLTRTSITSTQSAALNKVMESNKDILAGYMFTAILDSRTSPICSHHNGKIYKLDDLRYRPPLHWNCRSSMVPVLKSKEELIKLDSDRVKQRALQELDEMEYNGNPPAIVSFGQWLKRQAMDVQTRLLGSEDAANLFRQGKLAAEQFITPKGIALSIQSLRAKAANATAVFKPRQVIREQGVNIPVRRPSALLSNPRYKEELRNLFIMDADDYNSTLALTNYKGTSLVGKQASRRRAGNVFDERNFSADPLTGEIKNNNLYDPDFNLYQERLDFMRNSKDLTLEQKDFIESVVASLDDKISINQQTVAIENLRVVFQRYNTNKEPWADFVAVMRAENRFSVQNVSRLLDTRSRKRSEMFVSYLTNKEIPEVQIMGKYYKVSDLIDNQLRDQRFIDAWRRTQGTKLARKFYFSGRSPYRAYLSKFFTTKKDLKKFKESLLDKIIPLRKEYKAFMKRFNKEPSDSWWTQQIAKLREGLRQVVDYEFLIRSKTPEARFIDDKVLGALTKSFKLVASGQATDYDSLAIAIGKRLADDIGDLIPGTTHTLKDYHKEGSQVLEYMRRQNLIRINFRGKTRRGVIDLDTGRASGGWGDTVSREVQVIDKTLLELQEAERRTVIARRLGTINARDRLYVKANHKTFFDARGNDTGIPIISASKFPDYDPKQIDAEMAKMMNHVMNVEYSVDTEFFDFMDYLVRFRDPRGNSKYYDSINEFRHEILNRGEAGYGLMATAKLHRQRGKNFRTQVFIDSRGRVYHRGYLTPTGGELVRPFLNSGRAVAIDETAVRELRIQLGALIGPATEALTQAGRFEIFRRNEKGLLEIGSLLQATTQRDRRIREFLEHPLIQGLEGAEVGKMARLALEYKRIYDHVDGNFTNVQRLRTFKTRLMIENDASSSGAQIIALSTGDRAIAEASNVLATRQKNRLYDLVATDTVNDPEFLEIAALRNANLTWEDLAKAAKAQNMVTFYGAGEATKTANVSGKLAKLLQERGFLTVTKEDLGEKLRIIDGQIKVAQRINATKTVDELTSFRKELVELVNNNAPVGRHLMTEAMDIHPDVGDFVNKFMNARQGVVGPKDFEAVSRIMSKNLAQRAPVTENFITFWKRVAKAYVTETNKVDIPWVTFDGKIMTQRYRPKIQERIEFTDPVTGRKIMNIYESSAEDGKLLGKGSIGDASIGLGVNGNHSNDAVIVRRFHLWGLQNGIDTGTIHDAFFTNIAVAQRAKDALRTIYADALEGDTIRKTLAAMRKEGLSYQTYQNLLREAKQLGLIDPDNKLTRKDILAPIQEGEDWYGIGP